MIFICPDCSKELEQSHSPGFLYCSRCDCNFLLQITYIKYSKHELDRKQLSSGTNKEITNQ